MRIKFTFLAVYLSYLAFGGSNCVLAENTDIIARPLQGDIEQEFIINRKVYEAIFKAANAISAKYGVDYLRYEKVWYTVNSAQVIVGFVGSQKLPSYEVHFDKQNLNSFKIVVGM